MAPKYKIGVIVILLIASAMTLALRPRSPQSSQVGPAVPTLVELVGGTCQMCLLMKPILDEIANDYPDTLCVQTIDVFENPPAREKYQVQFVPMLIFLDASGEELFRHSAPMSRADILAKWKALGIDLGSPKPNPEKTN